MANSCVLTVTVSTQVTDSAGTKVAIGPGQAYQFTGVGWLSSAVDVPDATTDQQIDIGSLTTVKRAVFSCDKNVTIQVAGTTTQDARYIAAGSSIIFESAAGETLFYVTNASGAAAILTYTLVN